MGQGQWVHASRGGLDIDRPGGSTHRPGQSPTHGPMAMPCHKPDPAPHRCLLFPRRDPAPTQIWTSNHRVHWGWRVSFGLSVFGFVVALIFLIEPRPSHWLPSLSRFEHSVWTSRWSEHKQRMRRWWRWRKKYATNTRLNV